MNNFEQYPELRKDFDRYLESYIDNFKNTHTLSSFFKTKHVSTTTMGEYIDGKWVQTPLKSHQTIFIIFPEEIKKVDFITARMNFYREIQKYGQVINQEIMLAIRLTGNEFDVNRPLLDQYLKNIRKKISLGYEPADIKSLRFSPAMSQKLWKELKDPANRARYMLEMEKILCGE